MTTELLKKKNPFKYVVRFQLRQQQICLAVLNNCLDTRDVPKERAKAPGLCRPRVTPKDSQKEERLRQFSREVATVSRTPATNRAAMHTIFWPYFGGPNLMFVKQSSQDTK